MAEDFRNRARRSFLGRMPSWLVASLVKAWFAGAVYYFVGWGLFVQDTLDVLVILGIVHGLVMDLLANRALLFLESDRVSYRRFLFFGSRRFRSVPVNLLYGLALSFAVAYVYQIINLLFFLGAEPILYGLIFMGIDMLFVYIKSLIRRVIHK